MAVLSLSLLYPGSSRVKGARARVPCCSRAGNSGFGLPTIDMSDGVSAEDSQQAPDVVTCQYAGEPPYHVHDSGAISVNAHAGAQTWPPSGAHSRIRATALR